MSEASTARRADRPNVVFILTDDQGPWAMGCAGNGEIRTPHLDRLAGEGLRFENFFCTSPVCSPARASLMTGKIPSAHGVHDFLGAGCKPPGCIQYLAEFPCYTDVLADNGYAVGLSGKWHLGDSPTAQHGFSHWLCMPGGMSRYNDAEMYRDGELQVCGGYLTDVIADDAIAFVEANRAGPFYASVHFNAPHRPWDGHPRDIVGSYDDCPFKTCPQETTHPWAPPHNLEHLGNRESLKGYFASVTAMDRAVGRILGKLDELGLREKTLVVFSSDNGYNCGHHGFWGKGNGTFPMNMYDNSVKVPGIFRHPGRIPAGRVTQAMVSQYDFLPTLLEYLHLPVGNDPLLPGRSYVPTLAGRTDQADELVVVFDEYGPVRMIRTPQWKYVHRNPYGPHELYDMVNDPDERKNLVDEKSKQALVTQMRRKLAKWFEQYVVYERDGFRLPIAGTSQRKKLDGVICGEEAFPPQEDTSKWPRRADRRWW